MLSVASYVNSYVISYTKAGVGFDSDARLRSSVGLCCEQTTSA